VNPALLLGREHTEVGAVEIRAAQRAAIAISRGGAPKVYAHTDPNEDAALVLEGRHGTLLAVADGHGGADAAEIAVQTLRDGAGTRWTDAATLEPEGWSREAHTALAEVNQAIRRGVAEGGRKRSRTTLAFALLRDGRILWASMGDSHVFRVEPDDSFDLAWAVSATGRPYFLGLGDESPESLLDKSVVGWQSASSARALALVTDGLSERGVGVEDPGKVVTEAAQAAQAPRRGERSRRLAQAILEAALAAHARNASGDNVAVAAAWLAGVRF
jgi:serine/threonine protein phosphatase PrpC